MKHASKNGLNRVSGQIQGINLTGKTVVIKTDALALEHREGDRRLLCKWGFGCNPATIGKTIYGTFRGEKDVRFGREDIEGLAAYPVETAQEQAAG